MIVRRFFSRHALALWQELSYCISRRNLLCGNLAVPAGERLYPTVVQVQTLNRCNGACVMCPYVRTVAKRDELRMEEALFCRLLAEMAGWPRGGVISLSFQNEPLLDDRLESWLDRARSVLGRKWIVEITTNGSLLSRERVERLIRNPPDLINVSLNAVSEETYAVIMPGLEWKRVRDNIELLLAPGADLRVGLRYILVSRNSGEYGLFRKYWHSRGVPVFGFECNNRMGSVPEYDAVKPAGRTLLIEFVEKVFMPFSSGVCLFPFSQVNVQADGDVLACCNDYTGSTRVGNVRECSLVELFNSRRYADLREMLTARRVPSECRACSLVRGRKGG